MSDRRANEAIDRLTDPELAEMFRRIWAGMKHEEARKSARYAVTYVDRSSK